MTPTRADAAPAGTRRRQAAAGDLLGGRRLSDAWRSEASPLGPPARRRAARALWRLAPGAVALVGAADVARGGFAGPGLGVRESVVLGLLGASAAVVVGRALRRSSEGRAARAGEQLELGAVFVVGAAALAQATGRGGEGPLFPLVYLTAALAVSFLSLPVGLALVALAATLQVAAWSAAGAPAAAVPDVVARVGFILLFAVLYHAVLWARLAAARRNEEEAVGRRLAELDERARELRLLAPRAGEGEAAADEARALARGRSAALEVEEAVRGALEVAGVALRSHTCALFLLSADDRELRLRECRSASDRVSRRPLPSGEGILGAALSRRAPVRLAGGARGATYYEDGTRPAALLAVPLVDRRGGHVRGVLVADRLEGAPFEDADEQLLSRVAGELIRAVESERLLLGLQAQRDEKELFYDAIDRLNRKSKTDEVLAAAIEVVPRFAPVDFAAITFHSPEEGRRPHRIVRAVTLGSDGPRATDLEGRRFSAQSGLVASAVRLRSTLPGPGVRLDGTKLFDEGIQVKGLSAVRVFPLATGDQVLGTLVVGSRREGVLEGDASRQLEVIALQVADALLRARLYEQTERLAITDGLTGVLNHRTFQARLDEQLALSRRHGKKLAVVLCDVDHFKSVNDRHGHPVGDVVLQGVARALSKEARATDVVARYGGEEFAVIMPETDAAGALVIAERIRERVAAAEFPTEQGPLRVTLSLGIAAFPADGSEKARLVEVADGCLYRAKRTGRNRSVRAADLSAGETPC